MESYLCDEKFIALIVASKVLMSISGAEFFSAIFYFAKNTKDNERSTYENMLWALGIINFMVQGLWISTLTL